MKVSKKSLEKMAESAGIKITADKEQEYTNVMATVEAVVKQNDKILKQLSSVINGGNHELVSAITKMTQQNTEIMSQLSNLMKPEDAMKSVARVIHNLKNTKARTITGKVTARDMNGLMTGFKLHID